jgi:hypothetical protein
MDIIGGRILIVGILFGLPISFAHAGPCSGEIAKIEHAMREPGPNIGKGTGHIIGVLSGEFQSQACRLVERSKISLLEDNSLEIGTGNFIAPNREFIETSRDLQRLARPAAFCQTARFSRNSPVLWRKRHKNF